MGNIRFILCTHYNFRPNVF